MKESSTEAELLFRPSLGEDAVGLKVDVDEEQLLRCPPRDEEMLRRFALGGGVPSGRGGVLEPEERQGLRLGSLDVNDYIEVGQHMMCEKASERGIEILLLGARLTCFAKDGTHPFNKDRRLVLGIHFAGELKETHAGNAPCGGK